MSLVDYASSSDDDDDVPDVREDPKDQPQLPRHNPQPPQPPPSQSQTKSGSSLNNQPEASIEKLPDASFLLNAPSVSSNLMDSSDHSSRVAAAMAQNASRKRDSNVLASSSSTIRSKVPRGNLPPCRNVPDTAGRMLLPPQISGRSLHSWMYPESILPLSLISVLSSSTAKGELEFLSRRQAAWEESFRDLYYKLQNNTCGISYVCTSHFVVMFTGGNGPGRSKYLCNAYISQSTRGLRSLLREHDLSFSMPLCHCKVEQVNTEDLVELSEIEYHNLGQTRWLRSFSDVDNSPESLLVFSGNKDVHGLYDVLLNYRSFLTLLSGSDIPVLCSPVPFQNAALSSPHIKCMEMRRVEHITASSNGSIRKDNDTVQGSSDGLVCSIEIKDTFLPPWIICGVCTFMCSEGRSFEASFVTEPTTIGLNVAFEPSCGKSDSKVGASESSQNFNDTFGIQGATVTSGLWSYSLKGLK